MKVLNPGNGKQARTVAVVNTRHAVWPIEVRSAGTTLALDVEAATALRDQLEVQLSKLQMGPQE